MGTEQQTQPWSNLRKDFYLLLLIVGISVPLIIVHQVLAAEVEINDLPYGVDGESHNGSSPTVVFTTDQIGYAFYRGGSPSIGNCVYSKTTNGGTSWGSPVTVDAQTDCVKIAVWYDQWTPGDNSGTNIHILTADSSSDDLWYTRLNTAASDSLTTTVNATGANQGGSFTAETSVPSITKGTDGDLYMGILDDGDTFVIKCASTCETATNWSEAGTLVISPDNDWLILMPLSVGNNIMAVRYDLSLATLMSNTRYMQIQVTHGVELG